MASLLTPRAARLPVRLDTAFVANGSRAPVTLVNVTKEGFMADGTGDFYMGQVGVLTLPGGDKFTVEIRWTSGTRFGARFVPPIRTFTLGRILALHSA